MSPKGFPIIFFPIQRSLAQRVHADEGAELSEPDNVGRVFGTAAGSRCAREAEGQVEGGFLLLRFLCPPKKMKGITPMSVQTAEPSAL